MATRAWTAESQGTRTTHPMRRLLLALLLLILVAGVGGATYLAFYPIPAPTQRMEVAVPNDKLSN